MMRAKLTILLLMVYGITGNLFSQFSSNRELSKGTYYIFGNNARIRDQASTNGNILYTLPIGSKVEVLQKSNIELQVDELNDFWYKIKYKNIEGYVWGALIADKCYLDDYDGNNTIDKFLILNLTRDPNLGSKENNQLEIRVLLGGDNYHEFTMKSYYGIEPTGARNEIWDMFETGLRIIRFEYEFNGEIGGSAETFLKLEGLGLDSLFTIQPEAGEGGYMCYEGMSFPGDENGEPNKIIIERKCADLIGCEVKGEDPCPYEYTYITLEYANGRFE